MSMVLRDIPKLIDEEICGAKPDLVGFEAMVPPVAIKRTFFITQVNSKRIFFSITYG